MLCLWRGKSGETSQTSLCEESDLNMSPGGTQFLDNIRRKLEQIQQLSDSRRRQTYLPRKLRLIVNHALIEHTSKGQSKRYRIVRFGHFWLVRWSRRVYRIAI